MILRLLLLLSLLATSGARADDGFVGRVIPPERTTWTDEHSGREITQWTMTGVNHHPYFTTEAFINDSTAIIVSNRTGAEQLYRLDLASGTMVQMTAAQDLGKFDHRPALGTVWYLDGMRLMSLNTSTLVASEVSDLSRESFIIQSMSVTCDGRYCVFSVNRKRAGGADCQYGPFAIYRLGLADRSLTQITMDYGFNIGHVQANPVDPSLILYCWQWEKFDRPKLVGHAPVRIWWVNIDGTDGGPLPQEFGSQRTHETWTPDGRNVVFVSKYRWGKDEGKHWLGIQSLDGRTHMRYPAQVSPGHQNMYRDNRRWIADLYDDQQPLLVLFTREGERLATTEILFRHASSMVGQDSHPHPRFSTSGTYVLFSTDRTGTAQVYTVRVDLDHAQ